MTKTWIDAHHHLWLYKPAEYNWITPQMTVLRRDYTIDDLESVVRGSGVVGTVAVQARQSVAETLVLLETAAQSKLIRGVVGWIPLTDLRVEQDLERFRHDYLLRGVRHVLHDEPDPLYMLRPDFNRGLSLLSRFGLTFDLLIFANQLEAATAVVDLHPNQQFVLDHIAKPDIVRGAMGSWREDILAISKRSNVCCKLSGLLTLAAWKTWRAADLIPYMDVVLSAFGPTRLMFGSDWPVLTVSGRYLQWLTVVDEWLEGLSHDEAAHIRLKTASQVYGLQAR